LLFNEAAEAIPRGFRTEERTHSQKITEGGYQPAEFTRLGRGIFDQGSRQQVKVPGDFPVVSARIGAAVYPVKDRRVVAPPTTRATCFSGGWLDGKHDIDKLGKKAYAKS